MGKRSGPTGKCDYFVETIPGNGRGIKPLTNSGVSESSKMKKGEFRVKEIQTRVCITPPGFGWFPTLEVNAKPFDTESLKPGTHK